jgi:protease I
MLRLSIMEHVMSFNLTGRRIAILATDGFEQSELTEPKRLLEQAGAQTDVIAPGGASRIKGWSKGDWGGQVAVDVALKDATPEPYDALVLPGGVMNPDKLRLEPAAIALIKAFDDAGKPVAAICHGPWTLIDAGLVRNRQVTSWPSLRKDLENAGAHWQDSEVVRDGQLITSRKPDDIPAFADAIIDALGATV